MDKNLKACKNCEYSYLKTVNRQNKFRVNEKE